MRRTMLGLALGLVACGAASAQSSRLLLETQQSYDSDDLRSHGYWLGAEQKLASPGRDGRWAVAAGTRRFESAQAAEDFTALRGEYLETFPARTQLHLKAQKLWGDPWSPALGSVAVTQPVGERWSAELSAERDLVDTVVAIRNQNLVDTLGASVDYRFAGDWTAVLGGNSQRLADGNRRKGRVARLVFAPEAADWFAAQLRARRIDSEFRGAGYFSPNRLEEAQLLVRVGGGVWHDRFNVSLQAGGGRQRVDGVSGDRIYSAELRARGWLTGAAGLELLAGCSNVGDLNRVSAGSGYRYCGGTLSLIRAF